MQDIINYLDKILKDKDKIVVGVSGGPDSMCLLYLLNTLKKTKNIKIIVAHINHNLRKESKEEAEFVKKITKKYQNTFEILNIENFKKGGIEEQARIKRYNFYQELLKKYKANIIMTAHHADDLMETILMRQVRGSNLKGYAGFSKETNYPNYKLIRPLIEHTKEEIETFNKENNIEFRIDKSNFDLSITRNRYRLKILPLLKEENKNVHQKYLKFSNHLNEINDFLENITKTALTKAISFGKVNLFEFNKLENLIKKEVIKCFLKDEYQNEINSLNDKHLKLILELCESLKPNQMLNLPQKRRLIKSYQKLYFQKEEEVLEEKELTDKITLNNGYIIKLQDCDIEKSNYVLRLNSKEIRFPLKVRTKKDGDFIAIKNLNGTKKVKDIFINEKVQLTERKKIPIVTDSNNNILWICGLKKSKFDKNIDEFYDIIYKYVKEEEK